MGGLYEEFGVSEYKDLKKLVFSKFKEKYKFLSHSLCKKLLDSLENDFNKLKELYEEDLDEVKNYLNEITEKKKQYIINILPNEDMDYVIKRVLLYLDFEE